MTDVRYSIPGVPPEAAKGITAFAPAFVRHAASGAQQYKNLLRGYPGTRAIPMEARRLTQISPDYGDLSMAGGARSSDAPDAIWPQLYYQDTASERPGGNEPAVQIHDPQHPGLTSLIPIPAEDGRAAYTQHSARLTRRAILNRAGQVPVFPRIYEPRTGWWNG